jgi:hypothetical protein
VLRGQVVTVFYNPVKTSFALDDLAGKTQQEAIDYLNGQGLVLNSAIVTENNPDVEAGKVIRTDPAAGTQVNQGDVITLVISAGVNQVAIPPVTGLSEADATANLTTDAYQFVITVAEEVSETVELGTAIRTDPAAGQLVAKGSPITLYVSSGPGAGEGAAAGRPQRGRRTGVAGEQGAGGRRHLSERAHRRPEGRQGHHAEHRLGHRRGTGHAGEAEGGQGAGAGHHHHDDPAAHHHHATRDHHHGARDHHHV